MSKVGSGDWRLVAGVADGSPESVERRVDSMGITSTTFVFPLVRLQSLTKAALHGLRDFKGEPRGRPDDAPPSSGIPWNSHTW